MRSYIYIIDIKRDDIYVKLVFKITAITDLIFQNEKRVRISKIMICYF